MKKLSSTLPNMVLSLLGITLVSGLSLGLLYDATKEPIARQAQEQQLEAIRLVAPPFDNNPETDSRQFTVDGNVFTVYPAKKDGKLTGAAVKGVSMNGFSGEIQVMVGFDANGNVRDYRVLKHAETPGLGSKMEAWFRDPTAARSILNKNMASTDFRVTKDGGDIDAITAATYSSRAFLETVRNAWHAYLDYAPKNDSADNSADASSGASKQKHHKESAHEDASTGASSQHKK